MKNAAAQFVGEPTQTFAAEPVSEAHNCIRAIVGASSGNLVEWYDFYAYAFTSIYFASTFFPSGNATSQLLAQPASSRRASSCARSVVGCSDGWPTRTAAACR